jgi:hypothetical protein
VVSEHYQSSLYTAYARPRNMPILKKVDWEMHSLRGDRACFSDDRYSIWHPTQKVVLPQPMRIWGMMEAGCLMQMSVLPIVALPLLATMMVAAGMQALRPIRLLLAILSPLA